MDLKVDINAEEVMGHVKKAILDSSLGKHIQEAIEKIVDEINKTGYGRDDIITQAVKTEVRQVIETTIKETFRGRIEKQVKEKITEEFIDNCFTKLWTAWQESRW